LTRIQGLVEALPGLFQGNTKTAHFVGLIAATDAADKPPVDEVVQDRHFFSQAQGVPDGEDQYPCSNLDAPRALADVQGLKQGRRRVAVVGDVVLCHQTVVEAYFLRVLNLLNPFFKEGLPVADGRVGPFIEETKVHEARFSSGRKRRGILQLT
jgi:hypothetical protein